MITSDRALTFGPFRLDTRTESVWRDGEELRLRPKTFAILRYLAGRPGCLVIKEHLLDAVWPGVAVGDAALAVCVGEIRKALGDEARTPRFIETVHRRGYRFIGMVQEIAGDEPVISTTDPFVGRERELDRLRASLERARRGQRQVGFVTGEPGIGKTALVEAFVATAANRDVRTTRGQCLDHYGAGEAYLPILEAVGRLARAPSGDRVIAILRQYAPTWLVQMPGLLSADDLAALQPRSFAATPERMLREMAEAIEALAAEEPLVLLLEDLHWSDPSTLDLITAIARRREPARLLLIGTYRPVEVIARGHPLRAVTQQLALRGASYEVPLELLSEADVARYLTGRFGSEVGSGLAPVIHRRTDGLPLFIVNVVDALTRHGLLVETAGRWEMKASEADVETAVPETLRQMIEQQLAGLAADEQRLLEAASLAGMAFSAASLAAAAGDEVEAVEDRCEALARREQFIRASGVEEWPDGTVAARYRFLHVLYQQVLYDRLPPGRRARLHLQIGAREEAAYHASPGERRPAAAVATCCAMREEAGYLANAPERAAVLAVHFEQGRDGPRALRYRRQAAESALQRSAFREAVEHLKRALHLLDTVPDADERLQLELDLQVKLGPTLHTLHGPAAPEAEAVYLRVRDLAERHHDPFRLYLAVRGLWSINYGRGRYADARENGEQLLALAELGRHTGGLVEAHRALSATLLAMGNPGAALVHIEHGQRLYDPERHGAQAALFGGYDAGTCAWDNLASARWVLGYPDAALTALREGTALARRVDYAPTTIIHLCYAAWIHYYRGDLADARQYAHEAIALGRTHGFSSLGDDGEVVLACVAPTDGGDHRSIPELYAWLCSERARRLAISRVVCLCGLARAAADVGNLDLSFEILAAIPEELRGAFFAPEIERIRGDLLRRRGKRDEAEQCFRSGIEIARRRAERSLELRASTSLARLLAHTKRRGEARRVLGGIYGWFTEGSDTADLRAARALLDELGTKP